MTLQAGWEDKVDFGLDLYQDIPIVPWRIPVLEDRLQVLTLVDLSALEGEPNKPEVTTDTCKVCHIQHERPVVFHEQISNNSSSSSSIEDDNETNELPVVEEGDDLDSMPELEDETDLDAMEIPVWLIPHGVVVTFRGG